MMNVRKLWEKDVRYGKMLQNIQENIMILENNVNALQLCVLDLKRQIEVLREKVNNSR